MSNPDSQLFRSAADHANAWVDWDAHNWHCYIEGYRRAADLLATLAIESPYFDSPYAGIQHLTNPNHLVYPIVFLYRHAIEVSLKSILEVGWQVLGIEREVPWKHGLLVLWEEASRVMNGVLGFDQDGPDAMFLGNVIRQLHERDPGSTTFRYPTGSEANLGSSELINLGQVRRILGGVYELLDAAVTGLQHERHKKREDRAVRQHLTE